MTDLRHHAIQVPATTANLGPGFDAFGAAVQQHLFARTVDREDQQRVVTTGEGADELSTDDDNLVWRSFEAFCTRFDVDVPDVALQVANDIPLERGLGSSSAAIVAGVGLARALTAAPVGDLALARLANELEGHPDNVVPAIMGGLTASVVDDAGRLQVRRIGPHARLRPILLVPTTRQHTVAARAVLPESLSRADAAAGSARAAHVIGALAGMWPAIPGAAGDLLHEPARFAVMPATGAVVAALREAGLHAWLSGAGPSAATVVPWHDQQAHETVRTIAGAHDVRVLPLEWDLRGAAVCPDDGCGLGGVGGCAQCPRQRV